MHDLVGTVPDREVAKRTGWSARRVAAVREARGLTPIQQLDLSPDQVALLGTASDAAVAQQLGWHPTTVRRRRRRHGIPSFRAQQQAATDARAVTELEETAQRASTLPPWVTPDVRDQLGAHPDEAVAERLGVRFEEVVAVREALGLRDPATRWPWMTLEVYPLLGVWSDQAVAERVGRTSSTVAHARRTLGRPAAHSRDAWLTPQVVERMGVWTDAQVADQVGRSVVTVARTRRELGISPPEAESWLTPELEARLGTQSDVSLARELGHDTPNQVRWARVRLGIAAASKAEWWTPQVEAKLGVVPDKVLAEELGVASSDIRAYRNRRGIVAAVRPAPAWLTPEVQARLGTQTDTSLAEELGHATLHRVRNARRRLGIAAVPKGPPVWMTDEVKARMGTLPDRQLATDIGVHWRTLAAARQRLGIRAWPHRIQDHQVPEHLLKDLATARDEELVERLGAARSHIAELREDRAMPEPPRQVPSPPPVVDPKQEDLERLLGELANGRRMARNLVGRLHWDRCRVDRTIREAQRAGHIECRGKHWGLKTSDAASGERGPSGGDEADLEQLIDAVDAHTGVALRDLSRQLGWKLSRTRHVLREAKSLGLVRVVGHGRGARWHLG